MKIGHATRVYRIEPLTDPVPRKADKETTQSPQPQKPARPAAAAAPRA